MKIVAVLAVLAVSAMAITEKEYRTSFLQFIKDYNKQYSAKEFSGRYATFKKNMDFIESWNSNPEAHTVGINFLADLTVAEYSALYLGTRISKENVTYVSSVDAAAPSSVDWRTKGAVTPIKNQGQCGSCWAFSAVGSTEGVHFQSTKNLVSLSEQNLVDCSSAQGNQGCNGGLMDQAFTYIISNKGIDTEASYPYTAQTGPSCEYKAANVGATLSSYKDIPAGNEKDLAASIVGRPTSVAIDASHASFQMYKTGVYYEPACSETQLDHGVLAVGYGASGKDYYIVKNSWGTSWGQEGYIWMSRNRNNNCGIASAASYPIA